MKNITHDIRQVIFDTKMDLGKAVPDLEVSEKVRIGCSQVVHDDTAGMINERASVQPQTP